MEYIILISLFLHLYLNYRYGQKGILACGLFAFVSHKKEMSTIEKELVAAKMKLLGIYNDARGGDSCGIAIDDVVYKGIDKQAKFEDYLMKYTFPLPQSHFTILGHDRKATAGIKVEIDNAHPFQIFTSDHATDSLIGIHNGTLLNQKEIATKYLSGVDTTGITSDSKLLYMAIAHNPKKVKEILEFYTGAAALIFYNTKNPNKVYVFKGESYYGGKNSAYYTNSSEEERPLFMLQQEEGIYFSSMEYPLVIINNNAEISPVNLDTNKLLTFTDGKLDNHHIVINRKEAGKYISTYPSSSKSSEDKELLIKESALPKDMTTKGRVYWWRGKYHRNGHVLASNKKELTTGVKLKLDENGLSQGTKGYNAKTAKTQLFWNGFLVKDEQSLMALLQSKDIFKKYGNLNTEVNQDELLKYVGGIVGNAGNSSGDYKWINKEGKPGYFTGTFIPAFGSSYIYTFDMGSYKSKRLKTDSEEEFKDKLLEACTKDVRSAYAHSLSVKSWEKRENGLYDVTIHDSYDNKEYLCIVEKDFKSSVNNFQAHMLVTNSPLMLPKVKPLEVTDAEAILYSLYNADVFKFEYYAETYRTNGLGEMEKWMTFDCNLRNGEKTPVDGFFYVNSITGKSLPPDDFKLEDYVEVSKEDKEETEEKWKFTDKVLQEILDYVIPTVNFTYTVRARKLLNGGEACTVEVQYKYNTFDQKVAIYLTEEKGITGYLPKNTPLNLSQTVRDHIEDILLNTFNSPTEEDSVEELAEQFEIIVSDLEEYYMTLEEIEQTDGFLENSLTMYKEKAKAMLSLATLETSKLY